MRSDNHTQTFTVFGGAYVTEDHGSSSYLQTAPRDKGSKGTALLVAGLLMFGVTAAAGAKATRTSWEGMRPQASYSTWMSASFADALY
jgi:hypothetical protein